MIVNKSYEKTVDKLRERMREVEHSYKRSFLFCFIGGIAAFAWEVLYYIIRLVFMARVWMLDKFDTEMRLHSKEFSYEWKVFLPNAILLIAPLLCAVLGYFSFKKKYRVVKVIFFILTIVFSAGCVILLFLGLDQTSFTCALLLSLAVIALTIDCFKKDRDDLMLSKIEGYPHFNGLVMDDVETVREVRETLRFHDKGEKGYQNLMDERDAAYMESNPGSETAKIKMKEKEAERDEQIADWLNQMIGK